MSYDEEPGRDPHDECRYEIRVTTARIAELEAQIESSPHGRNCLSNRNSGFRCDCWKATQRAESEWLTNGGDAIREARAQVAELEAEATELDAGVQRLAAERDEARAALVACRAKALEEAAKVAYAAVRETGVDDIAVNLLAKQVAAAIRALGEQDG